MATNPDRIELTDEQRAQILAENSLAVSIHTTPGTLISPLALGRSIGSIERILKAIAKDIDAKYARRCRVGIREFEIFPTKDGGLEYIVHFLIYQKGDELRIGWQTDEQMQEQIEGWKARRDAQLEGASNG